MMLQKFQYKKQAAHGLGALRCLFLSVIFGLALLTVFAFPTDAFAKKKKAPAGNPLYASIVVDSDTGVILHQANPDKKLHPASLTKVMTLLLLFDALDSGRFKLNDQIPISKRAAAAAPSKLGLSPGSSIRVKDAILALVTKSANDIAIAVAEYVGKSEDRFAIMMTGRARELGMNNTTFRNASGLHNPGQISTARDMAIMARYVINRYPDYYRYFSTKNFSYRGQNYHNHNHLMKTYKGMDGMKTGFINPSGFNLVASAVRGNERLIGVVFGGKSANSRNAHMKELLDAGFKNGARSEPQLASLGETFAGKKITGVPISPSNIPVPEKKPGASAIEVAGLIPSDTETPSSPPQDENINEAMGQGDYDPEDAKRIQTGMIAIAAHTGRPMPAQNLTAPKGPILRTDSKMDSPVSMASFAPPMHSMAKATKTWAIQIGAFTSRVATDLAIKKTLGQLPQDYASANPIIVPLRTQEGWLFRGRLSGFDTEAEATQACAYLKKDCIAVATYE